MNTVILYIFAVGLHGFRFYYRKHDPEYNTKLSNYFSRLQQSCKLHKFRNITKINHKAGNTLRLYGLLFLL